MLPGPAPTDKDYEMQRALDVGDYSREVQDLAATIAALLPQEGLERPKGSYSLKDEDDRTIAKVIPMRDRVFVGVRVCEGPGARRFENPAEWGLGLPPADKDGRGRTSTRPV